MFSKQIMLEYHLQYNHFPPISPVFAIIAQEAIDLVNEGKFDKEIKLPNGNIISAIDMVEQLHLYDFLDEPDDLEFVADDCDYLEQN